MSYREVLGKRLREKRKKLGLSQEALAEKACVSRSMISLLENGKRGMYTDVLEHRKRHIFYVYTNELSFVMMNISL